MLARLLIALALPPASLAAAAPVAVTDDLGRAVRLERPAVRIVSASPHATELLFAAGAGGRLVGAVAYSDFPPEALRLPSVGDARALDLERVLSLKPDLLIAWASGNNRGEVDKLARAGIPVFYSEPRRAEHVATSLERLGRLAGTQAEALQAAGAYRAAFERLRARFAGRAPLPLFYEIWHAPLMTLNGEHIVSDFLRVCGARNVFAELPALAPTVSLEAVIRAAPQIIASGAGESALAAWRSRRDIPASRAGNLCAVDPAIMHRATPRVIGQAEALCECIDAARGRASGQAAR
jgi:iron complex transport system substrate-binding protein